MGGRRFIGEEAALDLLASAREVRVAAAQDGKPVVRTMHAAIYDGRLWLHASPRSSLNLLEGQPVSVLAEEIVARIPSWMRDPQRACPATTWYRSAILDGTLRSEPDLALRAGALEAMMRHLQPEGHYKTIRADDPLYEGALRGLSVWSVQPESLSAVEKLGQEQPKDALLAICRALWRRGDPGDLAAIERSSQAHPDRPEIHPLPDGLRARISLREGDVPDAVALVRGRYWNTTLGDEALSLALRSSHWVGIERDGHIIATARAISDRGKRSWIYDVAVADEAQRSGLGSKLLPILLDHPALRGTEISLATRDAAGFYAKFGFVEVFTDRSGPYPRTMMRRPAPTYRDSH